MVEKIKSEASKNFVVRFPPEVKMELDREAERLRLTINDIIVEAVRRIIIELKTKQKPF